MRPGPFGNPFKLHRAGDRAEVLRLYKRYLWDRLNQDPILRGMVMNLGEAETLGCCCKPLDCHGDILVKAIEWLKSTRG